MIVECSAPANIALIKYMGKLDSKVNRPTNSSLSYTLENLKTFVRLTYLGESAADRWQAMTKEDCQPLDLSEQGQQRFLSHLQSLKRRFSVPGGYLVESVNSFPSDCGLASSASSFAALTMGALESFLQQGFIEKPLPIKEQAELSQQGSGSSCRSFLSPWVVWDADGVTSVEFPQGRLQHQVIVVKGDKKQVSSSGAHLRVSSSQLFHGRPARAEHRLLDFSAALRCQDWQMAFSVAWAEFWDMHALFETSHPNFGYMTAKTMLVLQGVRDFWAEQKDGPLVTMDAGANVHLLYRRDQEKPMQILKNQFSDQFQVLESRANEV